MSSDEWKSPGKVKNTEELRKALWKTQKLTWELVFVLCCGVFATLRLSSEKIIVNMSLTIPHTQIYPLVASSRFYLERLADLDLSYTYFSVGRVSGLSKTLEESSGELIRSFTWDRSNLNKWQSSILVRQKSSQRSVRRSFSSLN